MLELCLMKCFNNSISTAGGIITLILEMTILTPRGVERLILDDVLGN